MQKILDFLQSSIEAMMQKILDFLQSSIGQYTTIFVVIVIIAFVLAKSTQRWLKKKNTLKDVHFVIFFAFYGVLLSMIYLLTTKWWWIVPAFIALLIALRFIFKKKPWNSWSGKSFSKPKISGWQIAGWVLALYLIGLFGSWMYMLYEKYGPQPKPAGYYNFTQKDYDAKNVHPSNGGGGTFVPIPPHGQRSVGGGIETISYKARHTLKGGKQYKILMDQGGFNIIPQTYDVWYDFTLTYVNDPRLVHTMSVMQKLGEPCVHEKIIGDVRPQGEYYIVPSQDVSCEVASPENHPVCY